MLFLVALLTIFVSQIDFIASRFTEDANVSSNVADRLQSILTGMQVLIAFPLGLPINEYLSYVATDTGGVASPHNGFIFLGGVFGIIPLLAFVLACALNARVNN